MYKSKLQELCQKKSWDLPEYETHREGTAHKPLFSSTVTVNAIPFRSTSPSPTAKQAQNAAAMLAFHRFSQPKPNPIILVPSIPNLSSFPQPSLCAPSTSSSYSGSPGHSPDVDNILPTNRVLQPNLEAACQTSQISSPVSTVKDITKVQDQKGMLHVYKNQLQFYAQKRNLNLPVYSSEWEGPPHAIRFKCKVTIDGQTFENPKFYSTLKDAEHAAAEIALMSLSKSGVQEDNTGLYKNLLLALVQKEGFRLPVYSTNKSGEAHIPLFVSQVEVEGELFAGQEAKTKKQAEMSAAKVAYTTLKERKAHHGLAPEFSPNFSEANVITGLQHHSNGKSPVSPGLVIGNQPNKDKGESDQSSLFPLSAQQGQTPYLTSDHLESNVRTDLQHNSDPKSLVRLGLVTCNHSNKDKRSPGHSPNVSNILPTNRELQPNLEAACQTSQISSPVATVTDITKAQDQKSSPGHSPNVSNILPTNRELQPNLEAACPTSQISCPVATVTDITKAQDQKSMLHLYKNKLQCYAQKKNRNLPVYSSEWEGPPHAMRFKCKVTIDGQTFESPKFYSTLKDAEHAAAEIALMSLSPSGVQEDNTGLYKNLLQEFVQKEGFHLPVYSTNKSGDAHMPIFVSQVEVEGELFIGQEAKSKKHAEMSAAKVAFTTLKERKARQGQASQFSPNCLEANVITGLQHHSNRKSPVSPGLVIRNQPNKEKVENESSSLGNTNGGSEDSALSNGKPVPSFSVNNNVASETSDMSSTAVSAPSRRKKIVVYSRKTNVPIEDGGTLLPISDDKWVAYSYSQ